MKNRSLTFALLIVVALSFSDCAKPIVPTTNVSTTASYDAGIKNSGVISKTPDRKGFIVTSHFRDRYNSLVDMYGDQFSPALKQDEGFNFEREGLTCIIDIEHMVKMGQMAQWKRNGRPPTSGLKKLLKKVTG